MNNDEFCFWLKGYFEIGAASTSGEKFLNKRQLGVVMDHMTLVEDENGWTCGFIQWLQGMSDATRLLDITNVDYINVSKAIKMKLDDVFDKKTPNRERMKDEENMKDPRFPRLSFPNHPVIPRSDFVCSNLDIPKQTLDDVLEEYPMSNPVPRSGKKFCAK